jgi:hypothetical protein
MQQHATAGAVITFRHTHLHIKADKIHTEEHIYRKGKGVQSKKHQFFSPFLATKYAKQKE